MKTKVCIIGHFGGNKVYLDGQTIKTKMVTAELKKQLGEDQVDILDTHGGKKALLRCFVKAFSALKNSENVIMLPAHNGVRFFAPVLLFWNTLFHRRLHYSVVGGWLPELTKNNKGLGKRLKKFDHIYVETDTMKKALEEQGFTNITVVPNCKELVPLKSEDLVYHTEKPFRLCTFSRVNRKKGIEDAANVIRQINEESGRTVYELDIYGRIDEGEEAWFEDFTKNSPDYVKYCGQVSADRSVEVIKNYFALLFPTKYYTEGIPGTIIDAYFAGVPVISSKWQSYHDIVDDNVTGMGYEFDNINELKQILISISEAPSMLNDMRSSCLKKSKNYTPCVAMSALIKNME